VREDMEKFVPLHFWDFEDVFTCTTFNSLPAHSSFNHQINLEESFIPQRGKVYVLSPQEQKVLEEFLEESLSLGQICWLSSWQAASFFFQPKAEEANAPGEDPGLCPVQDYWYLNAHVIWDHIHSLCCTKFYKPLSYKQRSILWLSMCAGGSTTYTSGKAMSGTPCSSPTRGCSSPS
jgi:hypothetical protein